MGLPSHRPLRARPSRPDGPPMAAAQFLSHVGTWAGVQGHAPGILMRSRV